MSKLAKSQPNGLSLSLTLKGYHSSSRALSRSCEGITYSNRASPVGSKLCASVSWRQSSHSACENKTVNFNRKRAIKSRSNQPDMMFSLQLTRKPRCFASLCAFILYLHVGASQSQIDKTISALLDNGSYDPKIPPDYNTDHPVHVKVQIVILSIDNVDEASMDYSLTVYLRQHWRDKRLQFEIFPLDSDNHDAAADSESHNITVNEDSGSSGNPENGTRHKSVYIDHLELDNRLMDKVWYPDTFFINERHADFHEITVPNKLMHIFSNGTVFYSMRLSMTLTCHMTLTHYPFDRQVCPLTLGSYGLSIQNLMYHWVNEDAAIVIHGEVELPTFAITNWERTACNDFVDENLGKFSCMQVSLYLSRAFGYYLAQVYVPSVLIVILSWVNFWLDIDAIPARISLGLLSVLTMTTMSVGTRSNLPRVSYIKAIDVWTAACLLFVFSALLEFAYVNVTTRVEKRRMSMREAVKLATVANRSNVLANLRTMEEGKTETKRSQSQPTVNKRERARNVDRIARIGFPVAFALFNLFYWCFYLT
ncbi:hypothetical protein RRG08_018594 [Elysia crispata]|uniref:Uncharacterized protein n=1 Tax=Elysia crispata TaxID=231223 RepID=A0AAE1DXX6_9GAST|nr:hypothetical protein RRG08_018594 [Elysia crispata]